MQVRRAAPTFSPFVWLVATALVLGACDQPISSGGPTSGAVPTRPAGSAVAATSGVPPASSGQPSVSSGLLLTEVRFVPLGGDHAFVEISNVGSTAIDLAGAVLRVGAKDLRFDRLAGPLAPAAILLVQFDTLDSSEGTVLHAPAGFDLAPDIGTVELLDSAGVTLDRVAWGSAQAAAVPTGPGGIVPDAFEAGTTIARSPGATEPGQPDDWVVTARADASPGEPNPMPTVSVMLPLSGAILEPSGASVDWYPVPGAASYHVQVASDPGFATIVLDTTTTEPRADVSSLAASEYFWRVKALSGGGIDSRFSEFATFELQRATAALVVARTGGVALVADMPGRQLPVPLLSQHKDTPMLLLERNVEKGAHAWDVDHGTLDPRDPADKKNCAIAMTAMINHFYGGDLSQDRIGYEVRKNLVPTGPEWDLNYGTGITGNQTTDAFAFALGPGVEPYEYGSYDAMWDRIIIEINAGRPIAAANSHHGFVITGYAVVGGRRLMTVNDPWRGSYVSNIDRAVLPASDFTFWRMPEDRTPVGRTQEPGVTADSDGDGVVDFDETERFKTDPYAKDSDGDKLPDKADIVIGVFDSKYGYAVNPDPSNPGRDFDGDGMATELDRDSDEGGCPDGNEDADKDGHKTGAETWNFDGHDDAASCSGWQGTMTSTATWNQSFHSGTTTSTFTGLWMFEPVAPEDVFGACRPESCLSYRATGSINWTWQVQHEDQNNPGTYLCDETRSGTEDAETGKGSKTFYLRVIDATHFGYSGASWFTLSEGVPPLKCTGWNEARQPNGFFGLDERSSPDNPPNDNECSLVKWQIDLDGDTIEGSCYEYHYSYNSLLYSWSLHRVGNATPGH